VEQPIPLTVAITALPNGVTTSATPTFTFTATSTFTPTPPPVTNIYYQVDTWQGVWLSTTPTGAAGAGATPALTKGTHVLYAYAVDGGEATSINSGFQSSPLIGTITAYPFTYIPLFTLTFTLTYVAGANGTLTGSTFQTVDYGANGSEIGVIPAANYHFVNWSDGVLTPSRTDANVTANKNVTASFAVDSFTLTYVAGTGGTITGSLVQTVNYNGSGSTVTASPNTGYHFVNWTPGDLATASRTDANVTAIKNVTANFAIDSFTLNYAAGPNGSLTGIASQTVDYGASGSEVVAVPAANYHFVKWSDDVMTAARTDTNVTANKNVTANFALDSAIALTAPAGGAKWGFGTSHQITYTCAGITTSVTIELSRDNGSTWANLTTSATGGTGSFSFPWTVTEPGTINARVRVSGNGQSSTSAIFDIAEEKGVSGTFTATFANGQVTVQGTGTGTLWVTPLERPLAQVPDLSPFLLGDTGKRGAFFWDISQQGLTGMLTITLHYPPTLGEETFQLFRWDGSDWVNQPGTLNVANHTFTFSIDASLLLGAPFALAGDPHAMPSMNPWAIVLLAGGLFAAGAWFLRRRLLKAN
jgi:hypothetical protein